MRRIFTLLILAFTIILGCDDDDTQTIPSSTNPEIHKGIFGLRDAAKLSELGAEYTRVLAWDTDVEAIYSQVDNGVALENITYYNQLKSIHDAGVKIIFTFRWPDQNSSDPALYDRVPLAQERTDALDLLSRFLNDFGVLISVYSIQNEVGGLGPGTYTESDMFNDGNGSAAALWWQAIVDRVNLEKANNSNLSHLQISSPVPVLLKRLVFDSNGLPQTNIDFFYETIQFGNDYCDFIDFHFNTFSIEEHDFALDFLKPLVGKPMMATEWSEVSSANTYVSEAISSQLEAMAASSNFSIPSTVTTNDELVEYLYNTQGPLGLWEFMVDESGYHQDFMKESSDKLAAAGFEILCWNSGWQEGLTAYDLRSFYATKTVFGADNEMLNFTSEFRDL